MKNTNTYLNRYWKHYAFGVLLSLLLSTASHGQLKVRAGEKITEVGERQEMQCGAHLIVLTCGHSDEIAQRQKSRPRLCNDNRVDFIAKDGNSKTITTVSKGPHRDKTPVQVDCIVLLPINAYEVAVWTHDTASTFAITAAENGVRLNDDKGKNLGLANYPIYKYRVDYQESKTLTRLQIKE